MNDKEFVLVSQGIEIYRTKSQENAVNMVKEYNDEYFDYKQKCYDNYERPADNYVDLEIEYSNEKEKDKEIERLNNILDELEMDSISGYYKPESNDSDYLEGYDDGATLTANSFHNQIKKLRGEKNV